MKSMAELIAYSRAYPDKLNYGSAGTGTSNNLKIEFIKSITGLKATHIPYKSDADVLRELAAGTVQFSMATPQSAQPFLSSGKVRGAGQPLPQVPRTRQIRIQGLDKTEPYGFYGIIGPAGLPQSIVDQSNQAINRVSAMPEVRKLIVESYFMTLVSESSTQSRDFTLSALGKARELVKMIKPDVK
ncbi:hypothetical protein GXN78_39675 (plasmid) [Variovorax sp. WS11]|nr:hypothetical protein [Variovorax sp. WS11]